MSSKGWIGVDFDGTLVEYHGWKGVHHVGEPVPRMIARVKHWLSEGREVRIFTARVYPREDKSHHIARKIIENWSLWTFGQVLPVTYEKDFMMIELWDDRAVAVELNTGRRKDEPDDFDLGGEILAISDKDAVKEWNKRVEHPQSWQEPRPMADKS